MTHAAAKASIDDILAMVQQGQSARQIGEEFGYTKSGMRSLLLRVNAVTSPNRGFRWTKAVLQTATDLYNGGKTAAQIADLIGSADLGYPSRNAVIGKLNRAGLRREPRQVKPPRVPKAPRVTRQNTQKNLPVMREKPAKLSKVTLKTIDTGVEPRHYLTRVWKKECAWPVDGEGHDTLSCCAPTAGQIYCPAHMSRAYTNHRTPEQVAQETAQARANMAANRAKAAA